MKKRERRHIAFYKKWYFWLIISLIFVSTCLLILIPDINLRTTIIGVCGIWGSSIATIFIGVIAERQNERFEFRSRKESTIKEIREEERLFLLDFNDVCTPGKYIKLAEGIIGHSGDGDAAEIIVIAEHCQAMDDLCRFMSNITLYEYCPIYAKELFEKIKEMLLYLQNELNPANVRKLGHDYKGKAGKFAEDIIDWTKDTNELKAKYIANFQVLISLINKCDNLVSLNKQIERITSKSQAFREEFVLSNYFEKSEK